MLLALCDDIYYLDHAYLQVAYYCCWSESSQTCDFVYKKIYTENTEIKNIDGLMLSRHRRCRVSLVQLQSIT